MRPEVSGYVGERGEVALSGGEGTKRIVIDRGRFLGVPELAEAKTECEDWAMRAGSKTKAGERRGEGPDCRMSDGLESFL